MKKTSLAKRIVMTVLAVVMVMCMSIPAFAAESINVSAASNEGVMPLSNPATTPEIPVGGDYELTVDLSSYLGINKIFSITTEYATYPANGQFTGGVTCQVYKPNGELLCAWFMNASDYRSEEFTLPSSGQYRVVIWNDTNVKVKVTAKWL